MTPSSYSRESIAEIVKIRGKVTLLGAGQVNAKNVSLGDRLSEDASIVTYKKIFVRVKFDDGSTISLGPRSKIIVSKMNKSGKGILTLLKGQLRSKVIGAKNKTKSYKLLIKTRSASLGVRGTEF